MSLNNLSTLDSAVSRSISPENFTGEKGKGGTALTGTGEKCAEGLGQGWKVSPSVRIGPGENFEMADIAGPGTIEQIWMTPSGKRRFNILRIYWDDQDQPSVECPVGDFFACGWGLFAQVNSIPIAVNPNKGVNSYWEMPFRKRCRITVTNISPDPMTLYYQVDYTLTDVPDDAAHFHAQFRRVNGVPFGEVYTILDGVKGAGQFVGTYMMMSPTNSAWWGEGEVKIYLDDDTAFPTICGTGTEDYFCGSYDFVDKRTGEQQEFTTPYSGLPQIIRPDGKYETETRFGMYRFHITDPIRFSKKIRVTAQDLGWTNDRRYLQRRDDISTVAYWYQTLPTQAFPALPDSDGLALLREPNPQ